MPALARAAVIAWLIGIAAGCSIVGPRAIQSGRLEYNEVLGRTEAQQALLNIVRIRYGEPPTMLSVASITANAKIHAEAGVELGFGPDSNYRGNLVPFSGGYYYEENPTISYVPVQGAQSLRQMMAPVPLDMIVSALGSAVNPAPVLNMLVRRINDIRNSDFMPDGAAQPDARFPAVVGLIAKLDQYGELAWVEAPGKTDRYSIVVSGYAPQHLGEVRQLLQMLDTSHDADGHPVVLDVELGAGGTQAGKVAIDTRSVQELVMLLASAIQVPSDDLQAGRAVTFPPVGRMGSALHIRRAADRPKQASVAVPYRGHWYYIDDTDFATKQFFFTTQALWTAMIAEAAGKTQAAPVLTIPVSK
jgi:hypothetical protein